MKKLLDSISYGKSILGNVTPLEYFEKRNHYDNCLLHQPQLNRFIPCVEKNGKWVVLEEKYDFLEYKLGINQTDVNSNYNAEYESASKNVLFDGWELDYDNIIKKDDLRIWFKNQDEIFLNNTVLKVTSYSDLTKYNLPLTDNGEIYFNLKN